MTIDFKPNDLAYWVYPNGDKALCTVKDVLDDGRLRVVWHKDNFINIMPNSRFVLAEQSVVLTGK